MCMCVCVRKCIHTCMHACMHAYIHTCIHTYKDMYIQRLAYLLLYLGVNGFVLFTNSSFVTYSYCLYVFLCVYLSYPINTVLA